MSMDTRRWTIIDGFSFMHLSESLTTPGWEPTCGFRLFGYLFLNASPSGHIGIFAVVRERDLSLVEFWHTGALTREQCVERLNQLVYVGPHKGIVLLPHWIRASQLEESHGKVSDPERYRPTRQCRV